jgi:penicillin amidase
MKITSAFLLAVCIGLIYVSNTSWQFGKTRIPPIGRFLDPAQGFWHNNDAFNASTTITLSGLSHPVQIALDSALIPHIFSSSDEDLYFAQGYITAAYRLWQMEIQTHAAAGRLSEIIGESGLENDRLMRRLGMKIGAEKALSYYLQDPTSKMILEQYTAGVNAYIDQLSSADLPFEYKLLDYKPEPWTTLKCAYVIMNMCHKLNMGDHDIEMTNVLKKYGKATVELLFPDEIDDGAPIVSKPHQWNFDPISFDSIPLALPEAFITMTEKLRIDPTVGSNNWVLAGQRTKTGTPILCGDPHLGLTFPSIWFGIHLHSPKQNVMGASLPGAPGVILGFNDSVAWSITNAQRDVVDWYSITFQDERHQKYLLDETWREVERHVEEFIVRGSEIFYDTVMHTHWGPIVYDSNFKSTNARVLYAFRWLSHDGGGNEVKALYNINQAQNHSTFHEAIKTFHMPAQNFVFASRQDIAVHVQGKFPVRRKNEGKFLLDGKKTSSDWQAFIPQDQSISDKNPTRGFVSSANQLPADPTYPYFLQSTYYEHYRNRRINQVLSTTTEGTVEDMMTLQNDNYNLKAAESLPFLLQHINTNILTIEQRDVYTTLSQWDFFNHANSVGAAYYEIWWNTIMQYTWDEFIDQPYTYTQPSAYTTIMLMKNKPDIQFFDRLSTPQKESASAIIQDAFFETVTKISTWKKHHHNAFDWANYKESYIPHLLQLKPLGQEIRTSGNHSIVNAMGKNVGPSWRMVVSLEKNVTNAWAIYPGGQSGNVGSIFYNDMVTLWNQGEYIKLSFEKDITKIPTRYQLTLDTKAL